MNPNNAQQGDDNVVELTTRIVESYLRQNQVASDQLPALMQTVHGKLVELNGQAQNGAATNAQEALPEPPVKPRNSVQRNAVICLECGRRLKTLKRHIRTEHGLEEDEYKQRWGLPSDMKLVAKSYSEARSKRAKNIGLGIRA